MKHYARIQNGIVVELLQTDGDITEMFHPNLVWVECDAEVQQGWTYSGGELSEPPAPPGPTSEQIEAARVRVVQVHMDKAARALRYDDIKTACTYADEPAVRRFQIEGQAFRAWRSLVWAKCYEILADVHSGARSIPTDSDLIAELPLLQLPAA